MLHIDGDIWFPEDPPYGKTGHGRCDETSLAIRDGKGITWGLLTDVLTGAIPEPAYDEFFRMAYRGNIHDATSDEYTGDSVFRRAGRMDLHSLRLARGY